VRRAKSASASNSSSHDSQLADLQLAASLLSLQAQVNNYAALAFLRQGGQGSLRVG
jgi:hypothetical protein